MECRAQAALRTRPGQPRYPLDTSCPAGSATSAQIGTLQATDNDARRHAPPGRRPRGITFSQGLYSCHTRKRYVIRLLVPIALLTMGTLLRGASTQPAQVEMQTVRYASPGGTDLVLDLLPAVRRHGTSPGHRVPARRRLERRHANDRSGLQTLFRPGRIRYRIDRLSAHALGYVSQQRRGRQDSHPLAADQRRQVQPESAAHLPVGHVGRRPPGGGGGACPARHVRGHGMARSIERRAVRARRVRADAGSRPWTARRKRRRRPCNRWRRGWPARPPWSAA